MLDKNAARLPNIAARESHREETIVEKLGVPA
jgi:hypothetical protein